MSVNLKGLLFDSQVEFPARHNAASVQCNVEAAHCNVVVALRSAALHSAAVGYHNAVVRS